MSGKLQECVPAMLAVESTGMGQVLKIPVIHKHSILFHISPKLFKNKHLKRRRIKMQNLLVNLRARPIIKTDKNKRKSFNLTPDVTINLVSDDESNHYESSMGLSKPFSKNMRNDRKGFCQAMDPLYVSTGMSVELSKTPNITLVPVYPNNIQQNHTMQQYKNNKRKRKSQQPKRISCHPTVNNESIVLSDDEEHHQNKNLHREDNFNYNQAFAKPFQHSTPSFNNLSIKSLQVDEEVTVSLVPRSLAAGTCSNSFDNNNSPFPMLPDETTVQTVIKNRTYELSLAKLREGLASSSTAGDPQSLSPSQKRKSKGSLSSPMGLVEAPPPISLKLSSDLSISLISDDDEEEQSKQLLQAEKILQQHPQLSVQHLQFPPAAVTVVHRREKLG